MSELFKKLNLGAHRAICVFNAPASFEPELAALEGVTIDRDPKNPATVDFAIAFATTQKELDRVSTLLTAAGRGDMVLWIAYPKGTSKRLTCEFNRDSGWGVLRAAGFDSVRVVAVDADWSALRFRRTDFIRTR